MKLKRKQKSEELQRIELEWLLNEIPKYLVVTKLTAAAPQFQIHLVRWW